MERIIYNILFVHGNSDTIAGQEISLATRIKSLEKGGIKCLVTVPQEGIFSDFLISQNITVKFIKLSRLNKKSPLPYLHTIFNILRLIRKENISIVHTSGAYPTQYCLPAARLARIPCIAHINQTIYSKWDLKSSFVQFADAIICVSEAVKRVVINSLPIDSKKVYVSYNGVSLNSSIASDEANKMTRDKFNIPLGEKIVGQVGQIIPRKGLEYFIKMARIVKDNYTEVKFLIVGTFAPGFEEYYNSLKRMATELGLKQDIIFTGFKQPEEIYGLINLFDVSVLASLEEGLGRVIFESSVLAKPVVSTNIDSISEAVLHNKTGLTVPPKNSEAMAEAVLYLLKNSNKAREFGENGKNFVFERFSVDNHCNFLINLYKSLLSRVAIIKKILFYEPSSGFGGSASALANIVKHLDTGRFQSNIAIKNYGTQIDRIENVEILKLRDYKEPKELSNLKFLIYFFINIIPESIRLIIILKTKKIDILHINTNIITGMPAIIASKLTGVSCVCHIRETRKLIKREKFFSKWVSKFIVLNKDAQELYKNEIPLEKIITIYDGVDLEEFTQTEKGKFKIEYNLDSNPIIGVVGRIVSGKGQKEFVQSAREVLKERPKARFVIVGEAKGGDEAYYKEVINLVEIEGMKNKVIFTGWRSDIKNIISDLDILVLPSTTFPEGLPNALIEALALSKPVVATKIPGPSDIVVEGKNGFLVAPGDIKAMAEKIVYLLDNQQIAKNMGEEGRNRAENIFDIKKQVIEIEKIYDEVLS